MAALSLSMCSCFALSLILLLSIYGISVTEGRSLSHTNDISPDRSGGLANPITTELSAFMEGWCRDFNYPEPICSTYRPDATSRLPRSIPPTSQTPVRCRIKQQERNVSRPGCEARLVTVNKCKGRCFSEQKLIPVLITSAHMPAPGLADFMETSEPSCCMATDHKPMIVTLKCKNGPVAVTVANPTQCQCS